jgi:hypothetical protein
MWLEGRFCRRETLPEIPIYAKMAQICIKSSPPGPWKSAFLKKPSNGYSAGI